MIDRRVALIAACTVIAAVMAYMLQNFSWPIDVPARSSPPRNAVRVQAPASSDAASQATAREPVPTRATTTTAATRPPTPPYAPMIQAVLDARDGRRAMDAVQVLDKCRGIDSDVQRLFKFRDEASNPKVRSALLSLVIHQQDEQRACQSVTEALQAKRGELVKLANSARMPGAGLQFLVHFQNSLGEDPEATRLAVQNAQVEANQGSRYAITLLAFESPHYDVPEETRWAYASAAAWIHKRDETGFAMVDAMFIEAFSLAGPPPDTSPEVLARVERASRKVVEAFLAREPKFARTNREQGTSPDAPPRRESVDKEAL